MNRILVLLVTTAAVVGFALTGSAVARDRGGPSDRMERNGLTADQLAAEGDIRIAQLKADLRLTADQEKNWPGIESALRDVEQTRAKRQVAFRAARVQQNGQNDFLASLNRSADSLSERSADMKKLADAAQPLYSGLDDQQKKRFAQALIRMSGNRDN